MRAILLLPLLVLSVAGGADAAETSADTEAEAREHHHRAREILKSQNPDRYALAYRELREARSLSQSPNILLPLGFAAMRLERYGEAYDAYQTYILQNPCDALTPADCDATTQESRARLAEIAEHQATVRLEADGPFWVVDTRTDGATPVVNEYGPFDGRAELRLRAGEHEFRFEREGAKPTTWSARLLPLDEASHAVHFGEPPVPAEPVLAVDEPEEEPSPRTWPFVFLGAGTGAALASAALFLTASSIQGDADDEFARRCPWGSIEGTSCGGVSPDDARAKNWRTAAYVTGGIAAAALITGTVLYATRDSAPTVGKAHLVPWLARDSVGVGLTGAF